MVLAARGRRLWVSRGCCDRCFARWLLGWGIVSAGVQMFTGKRTTHGIPAERKGRWRTTVICLLRTKEYLDRDYSHCHGESRKSKSGWSNPSDQSINLPQTPPPRVSPHPLRMTRRNSYSPRKRTDLPTVRDPNFYYASMTLAPSIPIQKPRHSLSKPTRTRLEPSLPPVSLIFSLVLTVYIVVLSLLFNMCSEGKYTLILLLLCTTLFPEPNHCFISFRNCVCECFHFFTLCRGIWKYRNRAFTVFFADVDISRV
jgi:hypothetical protein